MRGVLASLILFLLLPLAGRAQDAPPPFLEVASLEVPLDEIGTFEEGATMVARAAREANLGARWGWSMWQSDNTYYIVSELQSMAQLDDPEAWMKQFANTPGQATLMSAFERMTGLHVRSSMMVLQTVPEWSYSPAAPRQPMWVEVLSYVPTLGAEQNLDALVREAMAVLRSASYPFEVHGFRARTGDGVIQFVILYDDPAAYATASAQLEQNAAWQALAPRWAGVLFDAESERLRLRPELSYQPGM